MKSTRNIGGIVRNEREIAVLLADRVAIFFIGAYALLQIINIYTAGNKPAIWQLWYITISLALYISGTYSTQKLHSPFSYLPLLLYFIISPILVGNNATQAWTSVGFSCSIAVLYQTALDVRKYSYFLTIVVAVLQYIVARLELPSVSDNRDIQFFGSYFATAWILGIGFIVTQIRERYLAHCDEIDLKLDELRVRAQFRKEYIKKLNLRDFLNLQMHGTVLNSLLVLRNRSVRGALEKGELKDLLIAELEGMEISAKIEEPSFKSLLEGDVLKSLSNNINIEIGRFDEENFSSFMRYQLAEIVREVILNSLRHARAQNATILFSKVSTNRYVLEIAEDSPHQNTEIDVRNLAQLPKQSTSMARLMRGVDGEYKVNPDFYRRTLRHTIEFSTNTIESDPLHDLRELRYLTTTELGENFLKVAYLFAVVSLPALIAQPGPLIIKIIFALSILTTAFGFYGRKKTLHSDAIASILALSIFPLASFYRPTCSHISPMPWLFNALLAPIFLVSTRIGNRWVKWIPGLIFTCESVFLTSFLPTACRDILNGSTPAIPMIMGSAFLIGWIRNRNLQNDGAVLRQSEREEAHIDETEKSLTHARSEMLNYLRAFAVNFDSNFPNPESHERALNLEVQILRSFLLCSEYYEEQLARDLFFWVLHRNRRGAETKINILGEGKFQADPIAWNKSLQKIDEICGDLTIELSILNVNRLSIQIYAPGLDTSNIKKEISNLDVPIEII